MKDTTIKCWMPSLIRFHSNLLKIFIGVYAHDDDHVIKVYRSDSIRSKFTLCLDFLASTSSFNRVKHMHDVYIANVVVVSVGRHYREAYRYYKESNFMRRDDITNAAKDIETRIQTIITFDSGDTW